MVDHWGIHFDNFDFEGSSGLGVSAAKIYATISFNGFEIMKLVVYVGM